MARGGWGEKKRGGGGEFKMGSLSEHKIFFYCFFMDILKYCLDLAKIT